MIELRRTQAGHARGPWVWLHCHVLWGPITLISPSRPQFSPVWAWSFRFPSLASDILRPCRGG